MTSQIGALYWKRKIKQAYEEVKESKIKRKIAEISFQIK
jgi:hypothetical protein